jgi:hypothetical protein
MVRWTFADLDFRAVVHVRQHLVDIAHVEPLTAAGAAHKMIGFGLGYAIGIEAAVFADYFHRSLAN